MADIVYRVKETLDGYVPSNVLKTIKPGVAYYVGMPLVGGADGMLEPTDKDPEYICMADFKADDEVPRLDVPCMKVGPQIIFVKYDSEGGETITQISGGGGGGDSKLIVTANSTGGSSNSATGYCKYTGVTLDKTVEEIQQAINDGKMVLVHLYGSAVCYQIFPYDDSLTFVGFYYYYDGRAMELNNSVEIVRVHINSDSDIIAEKWPLTTKP